nr:zinc carboxypeptidase-like isoform X2 [Lepeophtheirus salmonis]
MRVYENKSNLLLTILLFGYSFAKSYQNYEVIKIGSNYLSTPNMNDDMLNEIINSTSCEDMDEFNRNGPLHILCRNNETIIIKKIARKYNVNFVVTTKNINEEIETSEVGRSFDVIDLNSFNHDTYLGVSSMEKWLESLEHKYNEFMEIKIIGKSHQNRKIFCIEISTNKNNPIVLIDAGIHAREWIAPATSLFVIESVLKIFNGESIVIGEFHQSEEMKKFQWHIIPNANPDGYHFTRTEDRFWSKNRRNPDKGSKCSGVNLNRNFPSGFGKGPKNPCARAYIGKYPLSEPETKAIADYVKSIVHNNVIMALSFHCFGQTLFTPFAYDGPSSHPLLELMHTMLEDATHHMLPNYYQYGLVRTYLRYKNEGIGGTSMDFYADQGIPFAYTWELPDMGQHGMLMPSRKIQEIGKEVMTGLSRMTAWIYKNQREINVSNNPKLDLKSTTSTISSIKSWNNCCSKIKVESFGPSNDQHSSSMGIYEAINNPSIEYNGERFVYKKTTNIPEKNPRFLYYLPIYEIWMVGNKLGQSYATLFHFEDSLCPEKLTGSWFYYDNSWKNSDRSLKVSCF